MSFAKSRIANLHWGLGEPPPRQAAKGSARASGGAATDDFEPDPDAELPHMVNDNIETRAHFTCGIRIRIETIYVTTIQRSS